MDTKFQTSFIPKRPVITASDAGIKVKRPTNLVSLLSILIFVAAIVGAAGLFLYRNYVQDEIAKMESELVAARAAFETDLLNEFVRLDARMMSAEELLNKHVAMSVLFDYLQNHTVRNIQYKDFAYKMDEAGIIRLNIRGVAQSYNTIALQSQVFGGNKDMKNVSFSDMDLDDKGNVTFTFSADLDRSAIAHKALYPELSFSDVNR